ncbi:dynein light chain LC8-type [Nematocida sp. AWRm77]|nr:dynein light chain LC8-type [Nematocida sp. AWRm77]
MEEEKTEKDILSEKKLEILTKDISEDIRAEVADICMKESNMKDIKKCAKKIKDTLDTNYGAGWNVIMGEDFTGCCSIVDHSFLELKVSGILILVFKSAQVLKGPSKPE